jgi:hypothetical protein
MPPRVWRNPAAAHAPKSLVIRGGLVRTFGGLATFLVLTFFCAGIYLLRDAVANPLAAQAATLIFGAFIIALATILLFYLLRPENGAPRSRRQRSRHGVLLPKKDLFGKIVVMEARDRRRQDLVYQRVYRDQSRIRL